jgi:hypothetical protein
MTATSGPVRGEERRRELAKEAPPPQPDLTKIDEDKYPELYRKKNKIKGSNEYTSKPFQIGLLEDITASDREGKIAVKLSIRKLYRPEDTHMSASEVFATDNNLLFWSDDVITKDAMQVEGKCFVRPEIGLEDAVEKWTAAGQFRFYFRMAYNRAKKTFEELPPQAEKYGRATSSKGKGEIRYIYILYKYLFIIFIYHKEHALCGASLGSNMGGGRNSSIQLYRAKASRG